MSSTYIINEPIMNSEPNHTLLLDQSKPTNFLNTSTSSDISTDSQISTPTPSNLPHGYDIKWTDDLDEILKKSVKAKNFIWNEVLTHMKELVKDANTEIPVQKIAPCLNSDNSSPSSSPISFNNPVYRNLTVIDCKVRWIQLNNNDKNSLYPTWSEEEKNKFVSLVHEAQKGNNDELSKVINVGDSISRIICWSNIARLMNRDLDDINIMWSKIRLTTLKKGSFTEEEDKIIINYVEEWENKSPASRGALWVGLEKILNREDKRISERWRSILSKRVVKVQNDQVDESNQATKRFRYEIVTEPKRRGRKPLDRSISREKMKELKQKKNLRLVNLIDSAENLGSSSSSMTSNSSNSIFDSKFPFESPKSNEKPTELIPEASIQDNSSEAINSLINGSFFSFDTYDNFNSLKFKSNNLFLPCDFVGESKEINKSFSSSSIQMSNPDLEKNTFTQLQNAFNLMSSSTDKISNSSSLSSLSADAYACLLNKTNLLHTNNIVSSNLFSNNITPSNIISTNNFSCNNQNITGSNNTASNNLFLIQNLQCISHDSQNPNFLSNSSNNCSNLLSHNLFSQNESFINRNFHSLDNNFNDLSESEKLFTVERLLSFSQDEESFNYPSLSTSQINLSSTGINQANFLNPFYYPPNESVGNFGSVDQNSMVNNFTSLIPNTQVSSNETNQNFYHSIFEMNPTTNSNSLTTNNKTKDDVNISALYGLNIIKNYSIK